MCYLYFCSPPELTLQCIDKSGTKHNHGESWKEDKCTDCICDNGAPMCMLPMCAPPPVMLGQVCTVRAGTEENCCPEYDCKGITLFMRFL